MSNKENVLLDVSIRLLDGFHLLDGFQLDDESPIPPIPLSDGGELFIHVDLETKNAVFKIRGVKPGDRIKSVALWHFSRCSFRDRNIVSGTTASVSPATTRSGVSWTPTSGASGSN
jgi:hypothetical protein